MKKEKSKFVTEFKLDPRITSYKYPIIKMVICVVVFIVLFYRNHFLPDSLIIEKIGNIVTIISLIYVSVIFFISILEIEMLKEKRRKDKRVLNDFYNPISIPIQSIFDYFDKTTGELVLFVENQIVDISSGSRSLRYKRKANIFNRVYYINEFSYYDELGFELFKKDLMQLVNNDEVLILFHKRFNYYDNSFKIWLENTEKTEDISFEMVDYDPSDSGDWRDVIINNTESEDNIH